MKSVELSGWAPLGSTVQLSISPRRTVLVGKNGAGKSLILEGLYEAHLRILLSGYRYGPTDFQCSFVDASEQPLNYRYSILSDTPPDLSGEDIEDDGEEFKDNVPWQECCWDKSPSEPIWKLSNGKASIREGNDFLVSPGTSLIALPGSHDLSLPEESLSLRQFFQHQKLVRAGLLREVQHRKHILIPDQEDGRSSRPGEQHRIERLAIELIFWSKKHPDRLDEFIELGRKLETWRDINIARYTTVSEQSAKSGFDSLISVEFDDINIGYLSDGTLRIAATLAGLLSASEGGMLLLEEPETGIHPGLLSRLLSILDSYSMNRQLLISTHSHQVVNWVNPDELRLVERRNGATHASPLSKKQVQQLVPYLDETGTLGDFVYSGGTDA
jgi:ABC-type Mn2+/Zn2+ transport system ATPase subunit